MQFNVNLRLKVNRGLPIATVADGTQLRPDLPNPGDLTVNQTRQLVLFEGTDEYGRLMPMLGTLNEGSLTWSDPITENPMLNDTEEWEVYNATGDAHPIHLHLVSFLIKNRQQFDGFVADKTHYSHSGEEITGGLLTVDSYGSISDPDENEKGWKDTAVMLPGEVTRVIAKFDREGRYVWHCHILSHEDHEMMRPFHVGAIPAALKSSASHPSLNNLTMPDNESVPRTELQNLPEFRLYPNPVADFAYVEYALDLPANVYIKVYNLDGRMLKSINLGMMQRGHHRYQISTDMLENGAYILQMQAGSEIFRERFLITR